MQNWFAECGASMRAFWLEDQGQDLIEYTLLLAFVALASATLFLRVLAQHQIDLDHHQLAVAAAAASASS